MILGRLRHKRRQSAQPKTVREIIAEYTAIINNPGKEIIGLTIDAVVSTCSPEMIYIYGPAAKGYYDDCHVDLLVIVDNDDGGELPGDIRWALADHLIDGNVSVMTFEEFESSRYDSFSVAYDAVKTGYIAYAS